MPIQKLAQQMVEKNEQHTRFEKAYLTKKKGKNAAIIEQTAENCLEQRDNIEELITWENGPYNLKDIIIMASITVCRLDMLKNTLDTVDLENDKTVKKDLNAAIRMIDSILAFAEYEAKTPREKMGLEYLRPRAMDTSTMLDRVTIEANSILEKEGY